VFKDQNRQYVFRAQIHSDQYGQAFAAFLGENAKAKLALEPKDVKVAIIHEDGPYGVGVAQASEQFAKERGLQIVLRGLCQQPCGNHLRAHGIRSTTRGYCANHPAHLQTDPATLDERADPFRYLVTGSDGKVVAGQPRLPSAPPGSGNLSYADASFDGRSLRLATYRVSTAAGAFTITVAEADDSRTGPSHFILASTWLLDFIQ